MLDDLCDMYLEYLEHINIPVKTFLFTVVVNFVFIQFLHAVTAY